MSTEFSRAVTLAIALDPIPTDEYGWAWISFSKALLSDCAASVGNELNT
jgi:hypothetical protein